MKLFEIKKYGVKRYLYILGKKICAYRNTKISTIEYAESMGVKIGKNVTIITPLDTKFPNRWPIFASEPHLIEIGDDTLISFNCTFLTHDGSVKVMEKYFDEKNRGKVHNTQKIIIGKDVFIGCNVTLLPGITIGDNAVVGAGSVVTKNIPAGEVWAGNPARYIKKVKDLAHKMESRYLELYGESETLVAVEREREREREREVF